MQSKELGRLGEDIAVKWLLKNDYKVLVRNYRVRIGEIDIICLHNDSLKFIEVKTRRNSTYGKPYEAVNATKLQKIAQVGMCYAQANNLQALPMNIEIVSIYMNSNGKIKEMFHFRNVTQ